MNLTEQRLIGERDALRADYDRAMQLAGALANERDAMRASLETEVLKAQYVSEKQLAALRATCEGAAITVEEREREAASAVRESLRWHDTVIKLEAELQQIDEALYGPDTVPNYYTPDRVLTIQKIVSLSKDREERLKLVIEQRDANSEIFERVEAERDALRAEVEQKEKELQAATRIVGTASEELAALRAALGEAESGFREQREEIARQAAVITEMEHQRATATAEIDRLDVVRRQQEADNIDLIAKLEAANKSLEAHWKEEAK